MNRYFVEGWPWNRDGFNMRSMKRRLHTGVKMQTGLKLCRLRTFQVHIITFPFVSADWKQCYLGWSQWMSLQLDETEYYLVTLNNTQLSLSKLKLWLASLWAWFLLLSRVWSALGGVQAPFPDSSWWSSLASLWWHDSVIKSTGFISPQSAVTGLQSPKCVLHWLV